MKKIMLASMALGALLFVGCGSSVKDMQDSEKKDEAYYGDSKNFKETREKIEWCLDKLDAPIKSVEEIIQCKESGVSNGEEKCIQYEKFESIRKEKADSVLDEINAFNCKAAWRFAKKQSVADAK